MMLTKLFFKGKLFRDNKKATLQLILGVVIGVSSMLIAFKVLDLGFLTACIIGGMVSGLIHPFLFKNLKAH